VFVPAKPFQYNVFVIYEDNELLKQASKTVKALCKICTVKTDA